MVIWDDLVSIALTPVAVVACIHLIVKVWPKTKEFIKGNREPIVLVSAGMTVYHTGTVLDNVFWHEAWSALINNSPWQAWMFDHGSLANIFFRQGTIIVGSTLQLIGMMKFLEKHHDLAKMKRHLWWALLAGVANAIRLSML